MNRSMFSPFHSLRSLAASLSIFATLALVPAAALAMPDPAQVRGALAKKTENYLQDGLFTGGEREVRAGMVKNIRRAVNSGFERVVIDLDADRAPYYQVAIESREKRVLVTLFGGPRLGLNAKKIVSDFKKSTLIRSVEFFPKVEDDAWTFALHLKAAVPVEVFELSAPTRIIFDLKSGGGLQKALSVKKVSTQQPSTIRNPYAEESDESTLEGIPE